MRAERVLETCLYVDDLAAAEAFYSGVLGLEVITRVEGRHVFFRCGRAVLLLFNPARTVAAEGPLPVPPHGVQGAGHVAFAMVEAEIDRWRQHLRQHGIEIEAEITWPSGGYSLYFRDPAGNSLELATPRTWGL